MNQAKRITLAIISDLNRSEISVWIAQYLFWVGVGAVFLRWLLGSL